MSRTTIIIGITALVILIGSFSVPILLGTPDHTWRVGDYQPCDPDTTASGSFEVVEFDGNTYIHAKSAGIGEIDGNTENVKKAPLCPIIIWGQSNAAYSSSRSDVSLVNEIAPVPALPAYYYGSTSRPCALDQFGPSFVSSNSMHPALNPDGSYRIGELEAGIIAGYCDNPQNISPYLINLAIPATALSEWLPGSQYMEWAHQAYADALSEVDLDNFALLPPIVVMAQGEADDRTPPQTYIEEFGQIYDDFEGMAHFKTWLIIQTKKANGLFSSEAQKTIVKEFPNVMMGTTITQTFKDYNGMMSPDYLHYSQLGDYTAGYDTMRNYSNLEYATENTLEDIRPISYTIIAIFLIAIVGVAVSCFTRRD